MERKEIEEIIRNYIIEEFVQDADTEISPETLLITGGIIDSFSLVSIQVFISRKFKVTIPSSRVTPETFDSINKIVTLVESLIK